ncbi:MAG: hypothetical protein WEG36_06280 [Gemmatimonadota bacterium]
MGPSADRDSFIVAVRSAGERTIDACLASLRRQLDGAICHVVNEQPFERALRRCYQIGLESGAEWMVTVDADVLVREGALRDLLAVAAGMPDSFVQAEGLVLDKFAGTYRHAGNRVYRTRLLDVALDALGPPGVELRPESAALARLAMRGAPSLASRVVSGVHDYEQYYRDIFRKTFVQGQKFPEWLVEKVPQWKASGAQDPEFAIATRGFFDGYGSSELARVDALEYVERARRVLEESGLREKSPLQCVGDDFDRLEAALLRPLPRRLRVDPGTRLWRIGEAYRRIGGFRMIPYLISATMSAVGERVRRFAERD